jgi:hypothetical protein
VARGPDGVFVSGMAIPWLEDGLIADDLRAGGQIGRGLP